jgi:UDP-glucose 4-epimerase
MRVLITGGAGRLGLSVCNAFLQDGFQVRVFDLDTEQNRKTVKQLPPDAEVFWGDMTQPDSVRQAVEGVDAVVHMAAILPPVADEKPALAAKVNVGGTATLVELLRQKGGRLPFVFTSSVAVFGPCADASGPINPDYNEPRPKGSYAETKLQAENLIRESGVDHAILRLTATMYLVFATSDLKRMYTVPLDNRIEFCHPDDTATAILNAIKDFDQVKGRTLVISGGPAQRMLYKDMIRRIMGVMGLPVPPARKFTQEPYYLDWYDTGVSQELLRYQRRTFADYLKDYSGGLARRYSCLFIPFMLYFAGPVFGRIITYLM